MKTEYTATEIANVLCDAENLDLGNHVQLHNRLKYIAKRGILVASRELDKRGTLAFAPLEVYRAAVLCELIGLAIDVRTLEVVVAAAGAQHPLIHDAPSMKHEGFSISRGGLWNAVRGVAEGEDWFLKIWRRNPSKVDGESVRAEFIYGDLPISELEGSRQVAKAQGRKPSRTHVTVDLKSLFAPIVRIVGLPE